MMDSRQYINDEILASTISYHDGEVLPFGFGVTQIHCILRDILLVKIQKINFQVTNMAHNFPLAIEALSRYL